MSSTPFAVLVATLLVGAGMTLGLARWKPSLLGAPTLARPAWDPTRLFPLAAAVFVGALWTGFAFWQGTHYSRLDCARADRVAEALERTDLSVRMLNRAVGEFVDAVGGLTRGARAATVTAAPIRVVDTAGAKGGP